MTKNSKNTIRSKAQKAESEWLDGNLSEAFNIYKDILTQRLTFSEWDGVLIEELSAFDMVIIERIVDLTVLFGFFDAADNLLSGMIALNEQAGNRIGSDYAILKRIQMNLGKGNLERAYKSLRNGRADIGDINEIEFTSAGLRQWEELCWAGEDIAERGVLFSRLYLVMGRILCAFGQYHDALIVLERGLVFTGVEVSDLARQGELPLQMCIATVLLEKGNLREAESQLKKIEPYLNRLQQPGYTVRLIELSGKLSVLQGKLGDGLQHFQQVLEICHNGGFRHAELNAMLNLAHILILVNQTSVARKLLLQVEENSRALKDNASGMRAAFLLSVAEARSHSLADTVPIAPSVSELWGFENSPKSTSVSHYRDDPLDLPQSDNYLAFFEDRALGFYWYLGQKNLNTAAEVLFNINEVFGSCDSDLIHLRLQVMEGTLAYYQNQFEQAEAILSNVCTFLRDLELKPDLWQAQRILSWCYSRGKHSKEEQHTLAESTNTILDEISGSLALPDQVIFRLNKWTVDEEYIAAEIDQLVSMREKYRFWRLFLHWKLLKRLNALIAHIDRYKDVLASKAVMGDDARSLKNKDSQSLLHRLFFYPKDRATLSFLILPDRCLIICTQRFSIDFGVSSLTRIQVREAVRQWHEIVSSEYLHDGCIPWLEEIYSHNPDEIQRQIIEQLADQLQINHVLDKLPNRIRRLTIIPDDSLNGFPFSTIVYNGEYLIERYALTICFESNLRSTKEHSPEKDAALLVAESRGNETFAALPGTLNELNLIECWLKHHSLKIQRLDNSVDQSLDRKTVLEKLSQAKLFHIACHGVFKPDQPDQSGFVFIQDSERSEILSLRDLSEKCLAGLQHVTLSNCWSADSFVLPGRWIISLPETLWRAGANSILGSLWPLNDNLAVAFMKRFYHHLDKLPRDRALQQTQLDCLHNNLLDDNMGTTSKSVYWSGFNLYGDFRHLEL
jgi:hypothetical protein